MQQVLKRCPVKDKDALGCLLLVAAPVLMVFVSK